MNLTNCNKGMRWLWSLFKLHRCGIPLNTIRIMKIMTLYLFVLCTCSFAHVKAQKVSLSVKNALFQEVALQIQQQTGYSFVSNKRLLGQAKNVTLRLNQVDLQSALKELFKEQPFTFAIDGRLITLIGRSTDQVKEQQDVEVKAPIQQSIKGRVVNEKSEPLVGASIYVLDTFGRRTAVQAKTDERGYFELTNTERGLTLELAFLGYTSQKAISRPDIGIISLKPLLAEVDEVILNAGYYSVKDKERTGSISKITANEIGQQPVVNPLAAMQGRMAGVNITQSSGTPGGGFDIQIRGRNSLRAEGNAPLYIVDGVPFPSQSASDMNLTAMLFPWGSTSPLNSINPNDIESIEVLKDADATAIYGSRGSNGVVLITTKKGGIDKTTFSVQSTTSVSTISKFMDLMDTQQYLKVRKDAFANDNIREYPANAYDINGTWDPNRYTDWQREFIGGKAVSHNTQFSVGGGAGRTSYLLSAGHRTDGTVYMGDFGYKRTNFLLNVNHRSANDRFGLQVSVQKSNQNNRLMANDLTNSIFLAPNAPALYDAQGNLNWENNTFDNPAAKLNSKYFSKAADYTANVNLSYNLLQNLQIGVSTGFSDASTEEIVTVPHTVYSPAYNYTSKESAMTKSKLNRNSWIVEPKIVWNLEQGSSAWNVVAGGTFETREQQAFSVQGGNFSSDDLIMNLANAVTKNILNDTETLYKYVALYGRVNYKYMDRYIVNFTGRRDGSSRFGPNNRFANFGAVGTAWLFSREKVLKNSSWLNFGKLRASYGITGSDLIGDYQYLNAYRISHNQYDGNVGLEPARLYNPDFSWESNKKLEAALELEFFNGRLAPSVAWYRNRSSSQLVGIPLPGTTGFTSVQANLGALVENSGWEVTLRSLIVDKENFKWSTDINLSLPKNKLLDFPNLEESTYALQYTVGYPVFIQKVYHIIDVDPETGLYQVEDRNGDGVITSDDRSMIMHLGQKYHLGIANQLNYKNFSLDFLVQFVRQTVRNPDYNAGLFGSMNNSHTRYADYFQPENQGGVYQMPTTGVNRAALQATDYLRNSNLSVSDGSFIRLKSVQLQYQLPQHWLKGTQQIYLQGYNLFTLTKFWGSDPETATGYLPALRTIAVGASFNF